MGDFKVGDRVRVTSFKRGSFRGVGQVVEIRDGEMSPIVVNVVGKIGRYHPSELSHEAARIDIPAPDVVAHPPHYRDGTPPGIEVIDIIRAHEAAGGTWETLNAVKYILRHTLKDNPVQDIRKAIQYLSMWVERQEAA